MNPRANANVTSRDIVFGMLCLTTFLVPWEELLSIPGFVTGTFLSSSAALLAALFSVLLQGSVRVPPTSLLVLGLFVLWCFLSLMWSVDSEATQGSVVTFTSLLVFTWMLCEFIDSEARLHALLRSYLLGCCVAVVMLLVAFAEGRQALVLETTRYTGGGLNQNNYALIVSIGIVIAARLATAKTSRWRLAYWLFILPATVSVLLTGSRAGAVSLAVSLLVAFLVAWSGDKRATLLLVLAFVCLVWLIPNLVPAGLLERVTEGTSAATFTQRLDLWRTGIELWNQSPIAGVGAGAFVPAALAAGGRGLVAHNTFIQILTETGMVGIGLMLVAWLLLLADALRLPRKERFMWLGIALVWTISAVSVSLEYYKITWFLYAWIMIQHRVVEPQPDADLAAPVAGTSAHSSLPMDRSA